MKLYCAVLYTRHFQFECFGADEKTAREELGRGLSVHAHQYSLAANWYDDSEIQIREIEPNRTYRDQEPLPFASGGTHLSDPDSFKGAKGPGDV